MLGHGGLPSQHASRVSILAARVVHRQEFTPITVQFSTGVDNR
jgi:acid phosphatase family membrane protein YuiD